MIDLELLRSNPQAIRDELKKRAIKDVDLDEVLKVDEQRRKAIVEVEAARAEQKKQSTELAKLPAAEKKTAIAATKKLAEKVKALAPKREELDAKLQELASRLPNIAHPSVPTGASEKDNKVEATHGDKPQHTFAVVPHWQLMEKLCWIDPKRSAKVSGARFHYMLGDLALLHDALVRFSMDELTQKGFTPILPPTLVNDETMYGAGMFPVDENDVYRLPKDGLNLAGTSEISVLGFHAGDVLKLDKGATKYVAYSTCYRREAGAAGKDQRGIIRMHQFDKVEMFTFAAEDKSWDILENELVPLAEGILKKLGLHFRRVVLSTGDLARKNQKTYDLETWLPSEQRYVETNSISNVGSFQSRRLGIKYVAADGSKRFAHTLNGTAMAFSRLPACIVEQLQTAEGKVRVPEVLQPYLGNRELLG